MAAAGLKIVLPGSFTDATLPVLHDDSLLTAGSLLLLDLAHSANPGTGVGPSSGTPADAAVANNIAYKECAAVLGSGSQSSLSGVVNIKGAINNGTKGKVERTTKGGLHVIVSQANALAAGDGVSISLASALATYLFTNQAHKFYVSFWDMVTRIQASGGPVDTAYDFTNAGTGTVLCRFDYTNGWDQTGGAMTSRVTANNVVGVRYSSGSVTTAGSLSAAPNIGGPVWGYAGSPTSLNQAFGAGGNSKWASRAFYRIYVEDLTVSGRSYATVDALDFAKYTADVTTTGGRYNGDTLATAVTSVP